MGLYVPALDADVWLIGPDNSLRPLSQGLVKWKEGVMGPVSEPLFGNIQVTDLPPGSYHFFQAVTPPGNMERFYFWTTELAFP